MYLAGALPGKELCSDIATGALGVSDPRVNLWLWWLDYPVLPSTYSYDWEELDRKKRKMKWAGDADELMD